MSCPRKNWPEPAITRRGLDWPPSCLPSFAKEVMERLGPEQGEAVVKQAVQAFGMERGKSIARVVAAQGKPLSFKNWLIYSDIASDNFGFLPHVTKTDLVVKVRNCTFISAAQKWGMGDYGALYCKYADHAILKGYNPDILLKLETRHETGKDHCVFRYIMNQKKSIDTAGNNEAAALAAKTGQWCCLSGPDDTPSAG